MQSNPNRTRHLIFLAHIWVCVPFLAVWVLVPSTHSEIPQASFNRIVGFLGFFVVYMAARTWIAFRGPKNLPWEYIFPAIDVGVVSMLMWLGHRAPLSNIGLLYFFPLAQAACTLNVRWAVAVAAMVLAGAALATHGLQSAEPFNTTFRYFFIFVLASLVTLLARSSADLREQLGIARDRNRIAQEMHDGVQGHLMTVSKQLELAEYLAEQQPHRVAEIARDGQKCARLAADELRYLVHRMRSPTLSSGFMPALTSFVESMLERHHLDYEMESSGEERKLPAPIEHAAFRILQEALTNVVRHSDAKGVQVSIKFEPNVLILIVEDDGQGFCTEEASEGVEGMRRRAELAQGSFRLDSSLGKGCRVIATFPTDGADA